MDLTASIMNSVSVLSNLATRSKSKSESSSNTPSTVISHSNTTALFDNALGTVASIGLTLAVYKLISFTFGQIQNEKRGRRRRRRQNIPHSFSSLVQVLLRGVLLGVGPNKSVSLETDDSKDEMEEGGIESSLTMRSYKGSCHCKSISFMLRSPRLMFAKDCKGKIRYPHITTNGDNFQLTSGTSHLSVYYVQLPEGNSKKGKNIAAHTFCNRCGVHILRAPDPKSNELEVNTNCLDTLYEEAGLDNIAIELKVTPDEADNGRGLSSGHPVSERLKTVSEGKDYSFRERDSSFNNSWQSPFTTPTPVDRFEGNKPPSPWRNQLSPTMDTKTTSADDSASLSSMGTSSLSFDGNPALMDHASSFRQPLTAGVPPSFEPTSLYAGDSVLSQSSVENLPQAPSIAMRDQLKYYMKKHSSPENNDSNDSNTTFPPRTKEIDNTVTRLK